MPPSIFSRIFGGAPAPDESGAEEVQVPASAIAPAPACTSGMGSAPATHLAPGLPAADESVSHQATSTQAVPEIATIASPAAQGPVKRKTMTQTSPNPSATAVINSRATTPAVANVDSTPPNAVAASRMHTLVSSHLGGSHLDAATRGQQDPLYMALATCQASGEGTQGARLCIRCKLDTCGGLILDGTVGGRSLARVGEEPSPRSLHIVSVFAFSHMLSRKRRGAISSTSS